MDYTDTVIQMQDETEIQVDGNSPINADNNMFIYIVRRCTI